MDKMYSDNIESESEGHYESGAEVESSEEEQIEEEEEEEEEVEEEEEEEEEVEEEEEDEEEIEEELEDEEQEDGQVEEEEEEEEQEEIEEEEQQEDRFIKDLDIQKLTPSGFKELKFANSKNAYYFYNEYGRVNGFGIRKSKKGCNTEGELIWAKFVCNKEGWREKKYLNLENRKRDPRGLTRCGCPAHLRVRLDRNTSVWFVSDFCDDHNHKLVGKRCSGLSRSHRKMSAVDIAMFKTMRKSGISTPLIFGSLAVESGGPKNLQFGMKKMYNYLEIERKNMKNDLEEALKEFAEMKRHDENMYWNHAVADDGSYFRLLWCDGASQLDYQLFGDVLAFDATYGKNKYKLPVIIFSGVNHHKQTCVFATAIVSNETEETYVWVLEQFLEAMSGKYPITVITDGDLAIRNAISVVFPVAHHRLCAWHLLRNATTNVKKPYFTKKFKKCMLYDYEIWQFEERWKNLVEECGLQDNEWVHDLYEKRMMWAAAHIRGKFFAGLRTTSRCEGLHSVIGKYVKKGYNLVEFVEQFQRCLENLRSNEIEADFKSQYTEPVLQTEFQPLEKCAAEIYTRELFKLFCKLLVKSSSYMLIEGRETPSSTIFIMGKYQISNTKWHVSYYPYENHFNCSCQQMESNGVPCSHIIKVLIYLHKDELPSCLVLERWTRGVKEGLGDKYGDCGMEVDKMYNMMKYGGMVHSCRQMCQLACLSNEDLVETRQIVHQQKRKLIEKHGQQFEESMVEGAAPADFVLNQGKTIVSSSKLGRCKRKPQKCSVCRKEGHNRSTCPFHLKLQTYLHSAAGSSSVPLTDGDINDVDFDDVESDE